MQKHNLTGQENMNTKIKTSVGVIIILIIIATLGMFIWQIQKKQSEIVQPIISQPTTPTQKTGNSKMCTQEAKLCPDGSSVSRTGPNCEFATCPKSEAGLIYKNDKFGFQLTLPKEWQNYKTKIDENSVNFELPTTDATWGKNPWGMVFGITATPLAEVKKLETTSCSQKCIEQMANAKIDETIKIEGNCVNYSIPNCFPVTNSIGKNSKYSFSYVTANHITDYPKDFTAELFAKADKAIKSFVAN